MGFFTFKESTAQKDTESGRRRRHFFTKRIDKRISAYQQELVETHYREVDNMYRQIRGWRHDYRNHIQTMKAYAASRSPEAA